MLNYSKVFRRIKPEVIASFQELMPDVWHVDKSMQETMMRRWLVAAAGVYGVEVPVLVFDQENETAYRATGGGNYNVIENKITVFYKASLVTLAHEFRHMLQHKIDGIRMFKGDKEHDARAWSISLFRVANPSAYKRAVNRGLLHLPAELQIEQERQGGENEQGESF